MTPNEPSPGATSAQPPVVPAAENATPVPTELLPVNQLTPEEQMKRFEDALKETDWGHQPC